MLDATVLSNNKITVTMTKDFLVQLKTGTVLISSDGVGNKGYRMVQYVPVQLYAGVTYFFVNTASSAATISCIDNQ